MTLFPPIFTVKDLQRFQQYVDKRGENECWPWKGYCLPSGYGMFGVQVRKPLPTWIKTTAHSIACFIAHGPAPENQQYALHSCDNPPCCNPAHLRWGSAHENLTDCVERNRKRSNGPKIRGNGNGRSVLTEKDVLAIRASHQSLRSLARQYGVTFAAIAHIRKRKTWRHLP